MIVWLTKTSGNLGLGVMNTTTELRKEVEVLQRTYIASVPAHYGGRLAECVPEAS